MPNFLTTFYAYVNEEISDPRTRSWPLVGSPLPLLVVVFLYVNFVRKWGPAIMKNRQPFNLDKFMIFYNFVQIVISAYIVLEVFRSYYFKMKPNPFCDPVVVSDTEEHMKLVRIVALYFFAKILELLDTVFFVLRKRWRQISALHVFHHAGMLFVGWVGIKYVPGGQSLTTVAINSFIHVVMYAYYLLLSVDPKMRYSIWWKKYITQMQLIQFAIIWTHYLLAFYINCGYPRVVSFWCLNHLVFIAALFLDFYRKAYLKASETVKTAQNNN